jgi:hypothetical protein
MIIDPYVLFAVLVATFFGGVMFGVSERKRRDPYEPIEHQPPPPPNVITFIRGRFVR